MYESRLNQKVLKRKNCSIRLVTLLPVLAFMWAAGFAGECLGCNVPVFRYALERWERDEYRLMVAAKGELSADARKRVDELARQTYWEEGFCNLKVEVVDIADGSNEELLEAYPAMAQVTEPTAFLLYPEVAKHQTIILQEPFSDETVSKLVSSAFVDKVMLDLLEGTTAVYVLVDSGDQAADDKAYQELSRTLEILEKEIELPPGVIQTTGDITGGLTREDMRGRIDPDDVLMSGIPLKIEFSVERLTRDQAEPVLRAIMMNCEADLGEYLDQPMVFPVFGRGRMLYPMVGESITGKNIALAGLYICGRCSCQVKMQNPGVDLLSHVDWDSYLAGSEVVHERQLPPLTGTAELAAAGDALVETAETPNVAEVPSRFGRKMLIVTVGVLAVVLGATLVIMKGKRN
jgi:hypothetical protein